MRKDKLYIAGSLFSEADINQRLKEGNMLESLTNFKVFNPILAPCNNKEKLPTANDIFWGDTSEVLESKCIVADISTNDVGVACELGIAWACNYLHYLVDGGYSLQDILQIMKKKIVYTHLSDIRKSTTHMYRGNYTPWGYNQYLIGCIEDMGEIKDSFQDVLSELNMYEVR